MEKQGVQKLVSKPGLVAYQRELAAEFEKRRVKNHRYTLRSFASFLGISPATLISVMKGQRHFHPRTAVKVAGTLKWKEHDVEHMIAEIAKVRARPIPHMQSQTEIEDLCDWPTMAILRMATIKNMTASPALLAKRLEIDEKVVKKSMARLVEKGWVRIVDGKIVPVRRSGPFLVSKPNPAMIRYQQNLLSKAARSLEVLPVNERMSLIRMIPVSPPRLEQLGHIIGRFAEHLAERSAPEDNSSSELYCLSVQLFPLSKPIT